MAYFLNDWSETAVDSMPIPSLYAKTGLSESGIMVDFLAGLGEYFS